MPISGETKATVPASMQDLKDVEDRLTKRQDDAEARIITRQDAYEAKCDADRKELRGELDSVKTIVTRVEGNVQELVNLVKPLVGMFNGVLSNPRVQSAFILAILAFLGFVAWKFNSMNGSLQQQNQPQIIVVPAQNIQNDGGLK